MSLGLALLGLPLLLLPHLVTVLAGIVLVAAGTFFAQAVATGFVGQAATSDRGAARGLYPAAYFAGGLAGARCSALCSTASAGRHAWPGSAALWRWLVCWLWA